MHDFYAFHITFLLFHAVFTLFTWFARPGPTFTYASPRGVHRVVASGAFGVLFVGLSRFYTTFTLFHTVFTLLTRFSRRVPFYLCFSYRFS